jgi:hypothetical protein
MYSILNKDQFYFHRFFGRLQNAQKFLSSLYDGLDSPAIKRQKNIHASWPYNFSTQWDIKKTGCRNLKCV